MAKLRDALKYLGTKVNGVEPKGHYVTDIIKSIADDYQGGEPTERVTLTYALGDYATGSVPEAVTVDAGETVQIDFETVPSYDGEGKVFAGWAATDGASEATYTEDGTDEITMNADVTLYPVFKVVHTLTYSLGNDATGSVPEAVTVDAGDTVNIDFSTYPSCVSDPTKEFKGWATTDEASEADYTEDGTDAITLNDDVTLYPVFAKEQSGDYITFVNNSNEDLIISHWDDKDKIQDASISSNKDLDFYFEAGKEYVIDCEEDAQATFNGVYGGAGMSDVSLSTKDGELANPNGDGYWQFTAGDEGTVTISAVG